MLSHSIVLIEFPQFEFQWSKMHRQSQFHRNHNLTHLSAPFEFILHPFMILQFIDIRRTHQLTYVLGFVEQWITAKNYTQIAIKQNCSTTEIVIAMSFNFRAIFIDAVIPLVIVRVQLL